MQIAAVTQNGGVLRYAPMELRADKEVVLAAIAQNGDALLDAPAMLRADKEVVLAAVAWNGDLLRYASMELRVDKEVVLVAVAQCGDVLRYASAYLRGGGLCTYMRALALARRAAKMLLIASRPALLVTVGPALESPPLCALASPLRAASSSSLTPMAPTLRPSSNGASQYSLVSLSGPAGASPTSRAFSMGLPGPCSRPLSRIPNWLPSLEGSAEY
jgi:hypothetical protein